MEMATRLQSGMNSQLWSAGDEDSKGEVAYEEAPSDCCQQLCLPVFTLGLVEAVDQDDVWKAEVTPRVPKILDGPDNKGGSLGLE
jgi:hypothetical protein